MNPFPASGTAERVVSLLRLDGNETQLTRALAVLMRENEHLRRATIQAFVGCGLPIDAAHLPRSLAFTSEVPALRQRRFRTRQLGRVDWRFTDAEDATSFDLVVEVKIDASPGPEQFERYLNDDRVRAAARGGVAALTKHPLSPAELPDRVRRNPKWLGQVRWHQLLPALLRQTPAEPTADAAVWAALLRHAAEAGDLGSAVPDWDELVAVPTSNASALRGVVLRAAAREVANDLTGRPREVKLRRRGETTLFAIGLELISAIEVRLEGTQDLQLRVALWPPRPTTRRKAWDAEIRRLLDLGWTVEDDHLQRPPIAVRRGELPLHLTVAEHLNEALLPLRTLLDGFGSVMVGRAATAAELKRVRVEARTDE